MKKDSDLNIPHNLKEWKLLIADMQNKVDQLEATYDNPLQRRLLKIYDDEQKHRLKSEEIGRIHKFESKEMSALWNSIEITDGANLLRVEKILNSEGCLRGACRAQGQFCVVPGYSAC